MLPQLILMQGNRQFELSSLGQEEPGCYQLHLQLEQKPGSPLGPHVIGPTKKSIRLHLFSFAMLPTIGSK